jgi:hypothetical protein
MDLSNYWQENKRFLVSVGIGVVAFIGGWMTIDSYVGADLRAQRARKSKVEGELRAPLFSAQDLERANAENEALRKACDALRKELEFVPRPEFRMDKGATATSRYFTALERTREDLKRRAGRAGLAVPPDIGMPAVAPTKEAALARYLEALDAIEQVVTAAIAAGCQRVDKLAVRLDPALLSGKPITGVERTHVEVQLSGAALPLAKLACSLQDRSSGRVLPVERADFAPSRTRGSDEVRLEIVLLLPHLGSLGLPASAEVNQ